MNYDEESFMEEEIGDDLDEPREEGVGEDFGLDEEDPDRDS